MIYINILIEKCPKIIRPNRIAIERNEQIITGLLELTNAHIGRTPDQAVLIKVENGAENGRRDTISDRILALLVRLVLEQRSRAKHAPEHRIRMLLEHVGVDDEPSLVYDQRDRVRRVVSATAGRRRREARLERHYG